MPAESDAASSVGSDAASTNSNDQGLSQSILENSACNLPSPVQHCAKILRMQVMPVLRWQATMTGLISSKIKHLCKTQCLE